MKPMDLSGLIKGLMVVIWIATALVRVDTLRNWAVTESLKPPKANPLLRLEIRVTTRRNDSKANRYRH